MTKAILERNSYGHKRRREKNPFCQKAKEVFPKLPKKQQTKKFLFCIFLLKDDARGECTMFVQFQTCITSTTST